MNKKRMIITRTIPFDPFLSILEYLEQRFPEYEKIILLQSSVIDQEKLLKSYELLEISDGPLVFDELESEVRGSIRSKIPDVFIITSKVLYAPGFDELIKLAKFTGAQDIYIVSKFFGERQIRMGGLDIMLDENEISRLSAQDIKTRFSTSSYYDSAEKTIDYQWSNIIYPMIKHSDFSTVLELAPGHGRNTQKLIGVAKKIQLVDANHTCIEYCKKRFKRISDSCEISFYVNDGLSLGETDDNSISFIYSWDSMVHFDKLLVHKYLREFARVLKAGGVGFVHHSNYGNLVENANYSTHVNPHGRSNMTKKLFAEYCHELGLEIIQQQIIDWGVKDLDCISVFKKP